MSLQPQPLGLGAVSTLQAAIAAGSCHYVPSETELAWTSEKAHNRECTIAESAEQVQAAELWLSFSSASRGKAPRAPTAAERGVLSRYECNDGTVSFLEPLTGIGRHPFATVGCNMPPGLHTHVFNTSFLVPFNKCAGAHSGHLAGGSGARNLFFDLGCSVWGDGAPVSDGSALGPSMPLFSAWYEGNCAQLDRLYGWEMDVKEPTSWWKNVPADGAAAPLHPIPAALEATRPPCRCAFQFASRVTFPALLRLSVRAKLHFYNVPVEEDFASASSFSTNLLAAAKPADFVAVKVDIDYPPLEAKIVQGIRDRPELVMPCIYGVPTRVPSLAMAAGQSLASTALPCTLCRALPRMRVHSRHRDAPCSLSDGSGR